MNKPSRQAKSIFLNALDRDDADDRARFIADMCGADDELREEVERLVNGHRDGGNLAERAAVACQLVMPDEAESSIEFPAGTRIGSYIVREQIGEGGMGVVYVAEQRQPVRRKVALKVVKPGMDSKQMLSRFESERQALAVMDHPNIARIFDAGTTEDNRSYFAMELVRGLSITEFRDQQQLSTDDLLKLFLDVCHAVQHAHQKGIIHRDIKPSNVLVTRIDGKPVVKVIDFGLAKAASGQPLTDGTIYTGFMMLMGTPAYMSPEQTGISGVDVDTRSDIYSLGVLLYELLTGTTPLDKKTLASKPYDEVCRLIREMDAPKPSHRLSTLKNANRSTVAHGRSTEPAQIVRELKGDLDWIVLKALNKDRGRRYQTASAIADDVQRYLSGEPVSAVAPSAWYVFSKYAQRHRAALATAAAFAMLLILATGISSVLAVQAIQQKARAESSNRNLTQQKDRTDRALELAKQNEKLATELRMSVEQDRDRLRDVNYANSIRLSQSEFEHGNFQEARKILAATADHPDRGFEWYLLQRGLNWERSHIAADLHDWMQGPTIAYSPSGDRIAICEWYNKRVRLFRAGTRIPEELPELVCSSPPRRVTFSSQGDCFAVWISYSSIDVYDANPPYKRLQQIPYHAGTYFEDTNGFDVSPVANELAIVDPDRGDQPTGTRVRIWTIGSDTPKQEFTIPYREKWTQSTASRVRFSPDGTRIAVTAEEKASVIDLATQESIAVMDCDAFASSSFSPDGKRLVSVRPEYRRSPDGLRWFDLSSEDQLVAPPHVMDIASKEIVLTLNTTQRTYSVLYSPDGKWIASRHLQGVKLWHAETGKLVEQIPVGQVDIAFSPDSTKVATYGDRSCKIWDIANHLSEDLLVGDEPGSTQEHCAAWAPDNTHLICGGLPHLGGQAGPVEIWNTRTHERELLLDSAGQPQSATALDWSRDGSMIALALYNGEWPRGEIGIIRVFDARKRELIKELRDQYENRIRSQGVKFSPDGRWLFAKFDDGKLLRWDTLTWNATTLVSPTDTDEEICFAISPDGRELAVGATGPRIDYFSVETGEVLRSHVMQNRISIDHPAREWAEKASRRVNSIDFSPDGSSVLLSTVGGLHVLNSNTGAETCRIPHRFALARAVFSPDGRIVTGDEHGASALRIFNAANGLELLRIEAPIPTRTSSCAVFSPDGNQLFVAADQARRGWIWRAMSKAEYERRSASLLGTAERGDLSAEPDSHPGPAP